MIIEYIRIDRFWIIGRNWTNLFKFIPVNILFNRAQRNFFVLCASNECWSKYEVRKDKHQQIQHIHSRWTEIRYATWNPFFMIYNERCDIHTMYTARLCYDISVVILQFLVNTCDPISHILSYSITLKPDRQEGCRGSGQISERCTHSKTQSQRFKAVRDLVVRCLTTESLETFGYFPDCPTVNGVNLMDIGILTISHVLNQNKTKANAHHMPNSRALPYVFVISELFWFKHWMVSGQILGLHQTNERRRYKVTPSLIGWAQT